GTFSAVYKAIDLRHHLFDNSSWSELIKITDKFRKIETQRDTVGETTKGTENVVVGRKRKRTASEDSTATRHVALKRIFQQSGEKRIIGEIQLLSELGAHPNIVSLITVHRKDDQFCLVMPYFEHMEFRDYYLKMPFYEMKYYFRSLFNALVHIHSHKILHRDIKPANFLYNPKARHGVLADFGLAQPVPTSTSDAEISTSSDVPSKPNIIELRYGKPGYLKKDIRPSIKANRAGTRGFRAPEVLMKVKDQTTAVDIWSVGVILLCFLTRRFPFFQSNSDTEAFCELAIIFGENRMKECATALGRHLEMSVPTVSANGISWSTLIYNLNVDEYFQVPKQAVELLDRCLTLNPTQRITAEEALQSDWLRED
ncbi:kinase-like domain-containing protein, partial [Paraphysoderma sedebokerense]